MPLPTIPSGNVTSGLASGFDVANSCRFNGDAYLHKQLGTATNNKICTVSLWIKPAVTDSRNTFVSGGRDGNNYQKFRTANDAFSFYGNHSSSNNIHLECNRVLRDPTAFYHVVMAFDSTQASSSNRIKLYVNGVQETSFNNSTYPAEDAICYFTESSSSDIFVGAFGRQDDTIGEQGEGYFAEVCVIDGQALTPTSFGEYDEDSPTIWKPKDVSELTFGNNGFYLDFEDSSNLGNDVNGGTDLTSVSLAATDQTTDTPTNNFCTMNSLNISSMGTLSEGNCLITGNSASNTGNVASTMAAKNGKWYAECKVGGKTGDYPRPGFQHTNGTNYGRQVNGTDGGAGGLTDSGAVYASDGDKFVSNTLSSFGASFANDNIINLAIDCDNGAAYVGVNNTWSNSGDPGSAGTKTGAILTWTPGAFETGFAATTYNSSFLNFNFGNPAYANSSDAADADGYGKFEYAPPTGYFALCTKNLAEYG